MANKKRSDGEEEDKQKRKRKSSPKKKESTVTRRSTRSKSRDRTWASSSQESPPSSPKGTKRSSERLKEKRKSSSPRKRRNRKSSSEHSGNEGPSTSGEANSGNVPPGGDGQSSPDSCPICLCRLENKSFTDSCFHTFCFVCLQEWSKQKPVCPLCKQKFKSIIHNVRSLDDYDQYYIQDNAQPNNGLGDRRFRYRTTLTNDHTYDPWLLRQQQERERQLYLLQRPSRITARGNWRRLRQNATSAFRKRVYSLNMRVQSVRTASGRAPRYRDITPGFFCRNPACTHRLVPWLNRELNVILHGEDHTEFILELIIDLVQRFDIQSEEFREHINPFTGRHTDLFIHEFFNFARSPYDMVAYDRHAVYDEPTFTVESDSDRADQEDVVVLTPPEPRRQGPSASLGAPSTNTGSTDPFASFGSTLEHMQSAVVRLDPLFNRVQEFLAQIDGGDTANSGWESPIPGPSSSVMWSPPQATTPPHTSESADPFGFLSLNSTNTATTSSDQTVTVTNSDSSSDSGSDIEIVGYEKPFEQRTPIALGSSDSEAEIIDVEAERKARKKSKKKKKKKSRERDRSPLRRMFEFLTQMDDDNEESSRRYRREQEDKYRKDRSRNRSTSRERSHRSVSRDRYSDVRDARHHRDHGRSPRRDRHEDRHREKERRRDYMHKHKKSHSLKDEAGSCERRQRQESNRGHSSSSTHDASHALKRKKHDSSSSKHHESQTKQSSDNRKSSRRPRSKSLDGRRRSKSQDRRHSRQEKYTSNRNHRSRSRSVERSRSVSPSHRRSRSRSISPRIKTILKRRTPEIHHESITIDTIENRRSKSSGSKVPSRFWSPKVKFRKLQSTSKSPSPRHRFHTLHSTPSSPLAGRVRLDYEYGTLVKDYKQRSVRTPTIRVNDLSSPEKSGKSRSSNSNTQENLDTGRSRPSSRSLDDNRESRSRSSDCQFYTDSSSPEKSRSTGLRSVASIVHRRTRSRSSDSSSEKPRTLASVIRVKSRSRSRSSDCQFYISSTKYRAHDSDDSSIEFIVAKPAKRHKKYKRQKKHKKRRYYVIDDTDSEVNHDIEILDVIPTKHKKKSKENAEEKKCKKHHTGHKKSSKKRTDGGETSQEQETSSRRAERVTSTESIELVAVDNRNVPPFIGAELDIFIPELNFPQEESMNLTQRKVVSPTTILSDSPDELHRKCEVSSSSYDVLEGILGEKPSQFDQLSVGGEIIAYPLHGQERGHGDGREDGSDSDRDRQKKRSLTSVKETIANITDTVERELAKQREMEHQTANNQQSVGENGQQEDLNRATNPAYEDGESLSHRNRPPFAMEWLSSLGGASANSSGTHVERKRPSADPVMSSVAFKSPRFSDNETMDTVPDTMATSSADEGPPSIHHQVEEQLEIVQDIPEITQSHIAMDTEVMPKGDSKMEEGETSCDKQAKYPKQATEGFGLLPPSCDSRNRSPSKDPVLFPVPVPSDANVSKTENLITDNSTADSGETTAQTISTIVEAVEKELSSRRSSQSEDSNTECTMEENMEKKSREIASVGGDRPKTPPPLAVDNMFSLGSDSESNDDDNEARGSQSSVDPNLYELVGQMRRSPSRSASMILLASMNAQRVFNAPRGSVDEQSNDSPEKDFVHRSDAEKLEIEVALPSTQGSLADISDIVGDLSKTSTSSSPVRLEVEKQRLDRIMSLTRMDLFEPESSGNNDANDSGADSGALDLSQSSSPLVAPSSVTDMLQKDIQTNNGSNSEDLTSLEKQMREKITARLEQKDLLSPPDQSD